MLNRLTILCCAMAACVLQGTPLFAQAAWRNTPSSGGWRSNSGGGGGYSYPEVYGPTGRRYGPTQAAYQYQLQYGRTWNNGEGLQFVNGFPGGGGGFGPGGWGGGFSPIVAPIFNGPFPAAPPVIGIPSTSFYSSGFAPMFMAPQPVLPNGVMNPVFPVNPQLQPIPSEVQLNPALPALNPKLDGLASVTPVIEPSTPEAQQKSIQLQAQGDFQLQQLGYLAASERYRRAIDAARDRVEPRYHLAITLLGRSRYLEAIDQLKLCVAIDPHWPAQAESLESVLGHQNALEKMRIKTRVVEWLQQDVRDPNRLFLMAVLLFLDGDERSKVLLDTAILLAGPEPHLTAFQIPVARPADVAPNPIQEAPVQQPPAANPAPPPPQPGMVFPPQPPAGNPPAVPQSKPAPVGAAPQEEFVPPLPEPQTQMGPILPPPT